MYRSNWQNSQFHLWLYFKYEKADELVLVLQEAPCSLLGVKACSFFLLLSYNWTLTEASAYFSPNEC